jgi:hypothetical protein
MFIFNIYVGRVLCYENRPRVSRLLYYKRSGTALSLSRLTDWLVALTFRLVPIHRDLRAPLLDGGSRERLSPWPTNTALPQAEEIEGSAATLCRRFNFRRLFGRRSSTCSPPLRQSGRTVWTPTPLHQGLMKTKMALTEMDVQELVIFLRLNLFIRPRRQAIRGILSKPQQSLYSASPPSLDQTSL